MWAPCREAAGSGSAHLGCTPAGARARPSGQLHLHLVPSLWPPGELISPFHFALEGEGVQCERGPGPPTLGSLGVPDKQLTVARQPVEQ